MKHHVLGYRCDICGQDAPPELKAAGGYHNLQTWLRRHKQAYHKGSGRIRHGQPKRRRERYNGNLTDFVDGKGW